MKCDCDYCDFTRWILTGEDGINALMIEFAKQKKSVTLNDGGLTEQDTRRPVEIG